MTFQMLRDETVVIQEGCFSSASCSGTVVLTFSNLIGSSLGTVPLLSNPVNYATRRPTKSPTLSPTATPTAPTLSPTPSPTLQPTPSPTLSPTRQPTIKVCSSISNCCGGMIIYSNINKLTILLL